MSYWIVWNIHWPALAGFPFQWKFEAQGHFHRSMASKLVPPRILKKCENYIKSIEALFNHICCRTLHAQLFFSQRLNFWHSTSCSPCSRSRKVPQGLRQKTERIPAGFLFSYSSLGDHGLRSPSPLLQCILQTLVSRCLKLLNRNIPGQEKKISFS